MNMLSNKQRKSLILRIGTTPPSIEPTANPESQTLSSRGIRPGIPSVRRRGYSHLNKQKI